MVKVTGTFGYSDRFPDYAGMAADVHYNFCFVKANAMSG
jgi:hypothetical protein